MTTAKGFQPATGRWEAFALAAAAPLGPFAHAHLAPKFPPTAAQRRTGDLSSAPGRRAALAIIDSGGLGRPAAVR